MPAPVRVDRGRQGAVEPPRAQRGQGVVGGGDAVPAGPAAGASDQGLCREDACGERRCHRLGAEKADGHGEGGGGAGREPGCFDFQEAQTRGKVARDMYGGEGKAERGGGGGRERLTPNEPLSNRVVGLFELNNFVTYVGGGVLGSTHVAVSAAVTSAAASN